MTVRVAVTGATGFLGQHVLRELVSRTFAVVATTHSHQASFEFPQVEIVRCELHDRAWQPKQALGDPDVLIHLAWSGLPFYNSTHHIEYEFPAQQAFLTKCADAGIPRIIVAGTCFEYGLVDGEIAEDHPRRPVTCYGEAKARLFDYAEELASRTGVELIWPRFFYLYGTGQSSNSIYSQLQKAIAEGQPYFDMSGGQQIRDYLPVQEASRLLIELALLHRKVGAVNVCSGVPVRLFDQVQNWINASAAEIRPNPGKIPYAPYEPMAFWGSRLRLNDLLGITCS